MSYASDRVSVSERNNPIGHTEFVIGGPMSSVAPFSSDQLAAIEFRRALAPIEADLLDLGLPVLSRFHKSIGGAATLFGLCDRSAVQIDRDEAAQNNAELRAKRMARADALNRAGIETLQHVQSLSSELEKEIASLSLEVDPRPIQAFSAAMKRQFGELEIKPSDISKLNKLVDEVATNAADWSKDGYFASFERRLADYIEIRLEADRGVRENIPVHKIIGLALFVGIWLYAFLISLFRQNRPVSASELGSIIGVAAVGWLLALFC